MSADMERKRVLDEMTEHEEVIAYIDELNRSGMLNEKERVSVEEKIRAITERQKRESDQRIEEIRERYGSKIIKQTTTQKVATITIVVVVVGMMLEIMIGQGYIFTKADEYRAVAKWVFVGLLPLVALTIYRLPKVNRNSGGFLTRWVIKPFSWLVGVPFLTFAIVISPLGYIALAGMLMPGKHVEIDAKVTSVERFSESKNCDQRATLQVTWASAEICLENRVVGRMLKVNDEVVLRGKLTLLGLHIDEIESIGSLAQSMK